MISAHPQLKKKKNHHLGIYPLRLFSILHNSHSILSLLPLRLSLSGLSLLCCSFFFLLSPSLPLLFFCFFFLFFTDKTNILAYQLSANNPSPCFILLQPRGSPSPILFTFYFLLFAFYFFNVFYFFSVL